MRPSGSDEVSVACYNMLCQSFCVPRRYPFCAPEALEWPHRWPRLQQALTGFGADVVALQEVRLEPSIADPTTEVTVARWPEVESFMAGLGYSGVLQRFSLGEGAPPYSSATFFLSTKFALAWHEERSRALLLGLECLEPGLASQVLCVANVHLESSPHRPHDRVSQLRSALAHLRTRQEAAGQDPASSLVLVCGDFNSKANEAPCTFLREGRLAAGFRDPYYPLVPATRNTVEHPYLLRDVYAESPRLGPPYTLKTDEYSAVVDFIWASRTLQLAAVLQPISASHRAYVDRHFLPNEKDPSDHLPIGAVLRLPTAQA